MQRTLSLEQNKRPLRDSTKTISGDPLLSDTEPLSGQEFDELLARAQGGDEAACERLVKGNLRLVKSIAARFYGLGYDMDDLFQIGSIGLVKAIKRFDPSYGVKFSTYAVPLIIGEIRGYLRDTGPIKVSRGLKELARRVSHVSNELSTALGREASINEIAEEMGLPKEEIIEALEATRPVSSLDEPIHTIDDGDPIYVIDEVAATRDLEATSVERLALAEAMRVLSERERRIIELRFFHERTQAEVAAITGLSQAQISRIERNALRTMRERLMEI